MELKMCFTQSIETLWYNLIEGLTDGHIELDAYLSLT